MPDSVMTLGTIVFRPGAVHLGTLSRSRTYRHNFADVLSGGSWRTSSGLGADTVTITGVVFPGQYGDADAVKILNDAATAGEPLTLLTGDGEDVGDFVVTALNETHEFVMPGGRPRKLSYTLSLRRDHNAN